MYCRVTVALAHVSARDLRIASRDVLSLAETALRSELEEHSASTSVKARSMCDMCAQTLVQRVFLPHSNVKKAADVLEEFRESLSPPLHEVCLRNMQLLICRTPAGGRRVRPLTAALRIPSNLATFGRWSQDSI